MYIDGEVSGKSLHRVWAYDQATVKNEFFSLDHVFPLYSEIILRGNLDFGT